MSVKPVQFVFALALMIAIDRWQPRLGAGSRQNQGRRTRVVAQRAQRAGKGRGEIGQSQPRPAKAKAGSPAEKVEGSPAVRARPPTRPGKHPRTRPASRPRPNRRTRARCRPRIKHSTSCSENWARPRMSRPPKIAPGMAVPGGEPPAAAAWREGRRRQAGRKRQGPRRAARGADRPEEETSLLRSRADRADRRDDQGDERGRSSGWASPIPVKTLRRSKSRSSSASKP